MQNTQLTIFLPTIDNQTLQSLKNKLPALKTLHNRADSEILSEDSYEKFVCHMFGINTSHELPIAAITGLADGLVTHSDHWLRADPVQFQADLSCVYLGGNAFLEINNLEANRFGQELNSFFKQDQLILHTPHAKRWYLQAQNPMCIKTHTLNEATGKNITEYLPTGDHKKYWRKLLTEIQMLLHSSQSNRQRLQNNSPAINGLWLWGAGALPRISNHSWKNIWTTEPLLKGLAHLANINCEKLDKDANTILSQLISSEHYLISLTPDDTATIEEWYAQLETTWFKPLLIALQKKQLQSLAFYLGNNKLFYINWKTIRYFWRRKK